MKTRAEKLYSTQDVAGILRLTPVRVRQLRSEYRVGQRYGRDWFFNQDDLAVLRGRERKWKNREKIG